MSDDKIFTINVLINGFKIPLKIPRKEEGIYRDAEKLLVKFLDSFQKHYDQRPTEEILTLTAFQMAVIVSKQELNKDTVPLAEKIQSLDDELKALLTED